MAKIYQIILFCLTFLTTRNRFAESKTTKVKIQSLYSGQFLNQITPGPSDNGIQFRNDDSTVWEIDWDAGTKNVTLIRKLFFNGTTLVRGRLVASANQTKFELEDSNIEHEGHWKILSTYSPVIGRYYHRFRSNATYPDAADQCINTPMERSSPVTISMCNDNVKQQEFLVTYVN